MPKAHQRGAGRSRPASDGAETTAAAPARPAARPGTAQRRYPERGLGQPGGKLPLFDPSGREILRQTVENCLARGWAEPWFSNPIKPDWIVCKLTPAGYQAARAASGEPAGDG